LGSQWNHPSPYESHDPVDVAGGPMSPSSRSWSLPRPDESGLHDRRQRDGAWFRRTWLRSNRTPNIYPVFTEGSKEEVPQLLASSDLAQYFVNARFACVCTVGRRH
jgi:hypothetical protein